MEATLEAVKRDSRGKNEARRLRAAGKVPAVVYGARQGTDVPVGVPVTVDPKLLLRILHSESGVNTLIKLRVDGAETSVLVKEYQLDPVTSALLHADFYQLAMDKLLVVTVPVLLKGEPRGVKLQGGLLDFVTREIEVECLPADIPEHIDIDVTEMELHQSTRVRDLPPNPKWKAVTDGETMLVHIVVPKAEEAAAATAAEGAPAVPEPEVAKKGKTDKDDEKDKKDKDKK
jgi:large subunit ribosomal protein L25